MRILSLGEMMVELSGAGPGLWRSAFAGDTYNTAWYLAALRPGWQISYGTRLGADAMSDAAVTDIARAGIGTAWINRDPQRSIGLYMIALQNGERSFSYWRGQSAARHLADDEEWLVAAFDAADVIYLSGITLAILDAAGRARLLSALTGRRVVFDPNLRPRLWQDLATLRQTITAAAAMAEICLPSFDDEHAIFDDPSPEATADRYAKVGAREVVVKNGTGPLALRSDGAAWSSPAPEPVVPVDTTGAGDSFNAGYMAARLSGSDMAQAVLAGQRLAAQVVQHPGALLPRHVIDGFVPGGSA
ncbi:MAG: sugar kinase [Gemmobacter sp.]|nr:sugar kinase [Gemmobacter sp.]